MHINIFWSFERNFSNRGLKSFKRRNLRSMKNIHTFWLFLDIFSIFKVFKVFSFFIFNDLNLYSIVFSNDGFNFCLKFRLINQLFFYLLLNVMIMLQKVALLSNLLLIAAVNYFVKQLFSDCCNNDLALNSNFYILLNFFFCIYSLCF